MSPRIRRGLALLLLSAALAAPLAADDHPNTDRGFAAAEKSFQIGEIDNVNVFNGNLVLTIPIGGSYPAGGALSYGLTLVYNSNAWDFQERDDMVTGQTYTQALPQRTANAGLGWTLTLGRLLPPGTQGNDTDLWVYQGADAADHVFYPTLHDGDADEPGDSGTAQTVSYTRDGSYLRKRILNSADLAVEFPDGKVQHFDGAGNLFRIEDRFGNWLTVTPSPLLWTLADSQGRTQRVYFQTLTQDNQPVSLVNRVELTAFGGSPAIYTFSYSPKTIARPCPGNDPAITPTVQVQMLTGVSLPDGSNGYQMALADYITEVGNSGPGCRSSGEIRGLQLPTLGRLEWTYQNYTFPAESGKLFRQSSSGVATRLQRDAAGKVLGTWTYQTSLGSPVQTQPVPIYAELTNTLTDPLGHWTRHYFSVYATFPSGVWSAYDYSLPFTRNGNDGAGRYLSTETHDKSGTLLRSTYVLYERDQVPGIQVSKHAFQDQINTNRRQQTMRTVYSDDGNRYADVTSSDFDGLGHYRTETTGGNFPAANTRTATTSYNPARGTYLIDPTTNQPAPGHTFTMWPASTPWVLGTYTSRRMDEAGSTAFSIACFDAATGFLQRLRTLKNSGTAESPNDGLAVYSQTQGNLTAEQSFGGDGQSLAANGTTCSMALPAPEYEIDHTYQSGARATSQYLGVGFRSLDQDIDAASGLPVRSRDTAQLATGYKYDSLGRLTWSEPAAGQGGWTEYVYTPATSAASLANVLIRRRQNGSETAPVLAQSQILFDSFGRVWQEKQLLPSGSWNVRETLYDPAGNKASVSEVQAGTPTQKTLFSGYDPFGRAATIQPPDGAAHAVTMHFYGVRVMDRTVQTATAVGSENPSITTEVYDRQGRLSKVTEPSGAGGANVTTTYGYDVGNRLAAVSTFATVNGASVTQNRFFNYDNLGFLRSETHPEKGLSGNGTVTYPIYDSRGHALRKIDGPHDLDFIYDAAERLKLVQEHGTGLSLKTFTYVDFNGPNDWSEGKLKTAVRNNFVTINSTVISVPITETYTYGGREGRVSQRDTASSTGESFTQGFTYNDLGQVSALSYPLCTHAGCTAPATFADVPQGAPFQREIEAIYPGVTAGCGTNPLVYCPNNNITRGQMALYLLKGKNGQAYNAPPCITQIFADVPCSNGLAPWINEIYREGITTGCSTSPLMYCPNDSVNNSVMAVYVIAALGVSPTCPAAPFADVPCTAFAAAFIAEEARRQITTGCGGGNFCPSALVTRAQMAGLLARAFDIPVKTDAATPRSVQFAYTQGLLTGVTSGALTYGTLSYYPNLLVNQVVHRNGVTETQGNDPNEMRRPASFSTTGPYPGWSSGAYAYDGAGNIKTIGTAAFTYDPVNRLVASTLYDGPTGGGTPKQQSYTFDAFGNLTNIAGTSGRATPTDPQTNRLNATGTIYDAAGNLTNWNGATYQYDDFNQMTTMASGTEYWAYLYTADDERIWSYDLMRGLSHWTIRDLGAKVLRDYLNNAGSWSVATDYLYRDGLLLAAETQTGQRHFHLDHLGTPRLITRAGGEKVAYHVYYPFGEEATAYNQDTERMKFTGHERDLASPAGAGDDLDYMHARHESPVTERFLSFDLGKVTLSQPQSWNRYAYALNNPLRYIDPDGRGSEEPGLYEQLRQAFLDALNRFFPPAPVKTDPTAQALVEEGEITQSQANRMSPGAEAHLVQGGLNQAGAALAAGAIFTGLKVGEVSVFGEIVSGYSVGGSVVEKGGELRVNVTMLGKLEGGGGTLRGLFTAFEKEATRLGATELVIEGRLAKSLFSSEKAVRAFAKLGYSFQKLADGTILLTKSL